MARPQPRAATAQTVSICECYVYPHLNDLNHFQKVFCKILQIKLKYVKIISAEFKFGFA